MKSSVVVTAALAFGLASIAASANELMLTSEKSGSAQMIALDFVSDGNASALQARFQIAGGESSKASLDQCAKGLPKTHGGQCSYNKGVLTVLVFSDTNAVLPRGIVSLGTIGFAGKSGTIGAPKLTELLAFDAAGQSVGVTSGGESVKGTNEK